MRRVFSLLSLIVMASAPIAAQSGQTPPPSRPTNTPPASQNAPPRQGQAQGQGQSANVPPSSQNMQTPPGAPQSGQASRVDSTWQNVKIDLLITDTGSPNPKKVITLLVTDGWSGQIRSNSGHGVINVDAQPKVRSDGRVFLRLTMEYQPEFSTAQEVQTAGGQLAFLNESLTLVVADGKSTLASQSADPRTERKVTVEVVATVVK